MKARSLTQLNSQQRSDCSEEWLLVAKTTVQIFSHILVTTAETKTCKYHTQDMFFFYLLGVKREQNPSRTAKFCLKSSQAHFLECSKQYESPFVSLFALNLCSCSCVHMVKLKRLPNTICRNRRACGRGR